MPPTSLGIFYGYLKTIHLFPSNSSRTNDKVFTLYVCSCKTSFPERLQFYIENGGGGGGEHIGDSRGLSGHLNLDMGEVINWEKFRSLGITSKAKPSLTGLVGIDVDFPPLTQRPVSSHAVHFVLYTLIYCTSMSY